MARAAMAAVFRPLGAVAVEESYGLEISLVADIA
jgi:hypothetical protein